MSMTIVVPHFIIPIAFSIVLAVWALVERRRDAGTYGGRLMARIAVWVVGSLVGWIIYLTWRLYA